MVQAAGLTMAVFLGLTLFTFQTKIDFSFLVSEIRGYPHDEECGIAVAKHVCRTANEAISSVRSYR